MAPNLTAFQRDLLYVVAAIGLAKGTAIKAEAEDYYRLEINHGRLYPNLDSLVDHGLIMKCERDRRTNEYELTKRRTQVLADQQAWEAQSLSLPLESGSPPVSSETLS